MKNSDEVMPIIEEALFLDVQIKMCNESSEFGKLGDRNAENSAFLYVSFHLTVFCFYNWHHFIIILSFQIICNIQVITPCAHAQQGLRNRVGCHYL